MNPFPLALAGLRHRRGTALALALLVALGVALGVGVGALERSLRQGAARAADAFPLIVGAPGSPTQLVLTAVYLQPDTVTLMPGSVLTRLAADAQAGWVSPIGFGDRWRDKPVVGVTADFVTLGGRRSLAEGRVFAAEDEAVIGTAVPLALGDPIVAAHGLAHAGVDEDDADTHHHGDSPYRVVGRLPPSGTPWDHAILVPIERVWEIHGLGNGHPEGVERIGPPWEGQVPGVPAVVVQPKDFPGAYALRARYRDAQSNAVFPAEVLVSLFRLMGDVQAVLSAMAMASAVLVLAAVFLAFSGLVAARSRDFAVLRALGAPWRFVLAAVWLELALVLLGGVAVGLGFGWLGGWMAADALGRHARVAVTVAPGWDEVLLALAVLVAGMLGALLPALVVWRRPPGEALKR